MKYWFASIVIASMLLFVPGLLTAGYIQSSLQTRAEDSPDELFSVLVMLSDRSSGFQISQALHLDRYTRQAGHALALDFLRERSRESQSGLLEFLRGKSSTGEVESFKGHWISNAVSLRAFGSLILEVGLRSDVTAIYELDKFSVIEPTESRVNGPEAVDTLPTALKIIGADQMWALGYTGAGRIVCTFDTGVDGTHPALSGSWRGNNGHSWQESWFDPVEGDSVPHWFSSSTQPNHGTHTMGIIVAHNNATGDTIGVAPGAQWISAGVIDIDGADVFDAFEWAADPDGNPNTIADVPDVVSNSWGYPQSWLSCEPALWEAIDNLEALGVVVLFAGGNDGSSPQTMRNPANRASTPYNSFAVGMVDWHSPPYPVASQSSRGPSDCDGASLKPQVVAPGISIRSTFPVSAGSYGTLSGTSMATPYVAGAVALLRQYNPNAPVDSIKRALMESALDIDAAGPDNNSGYGLIDIPAAMARLAANSSPNLFVSTITSPHIDPGDAVEITIAVANSGLGLTDVLGVLRTADPDVSLVDSAFTFGAIPLGAEVDNTEDPYVLTLSEAAESPQSVHLTLHLTGSGGYEKDIPLVFLVGDVEPRTRASFVHDAGRATFSVTNYGQYGLAPLSIRDLGLPGFVWPNDGSGDNHLYEMGLMIATGSEKVSDGTRGVTNLVSDNDFDPCPNVNMTSSEPGPYADQESFCCFDDSRAENPVGIRVTQRVLSFADSPDNDYVMMVFRILNSSGGSLTGLRVGLLSDWDFPYGGLSAGSSDRVGYSASVDMIYMFNADSVFNPQYRGVAVISDFGASSARAIKNSDFLWDGDGAKEDEKWQFISGGINVFSSYLLAPDHACLVATGPFDLSAGDSVEAAFAVIGARTLDSLTASAVEARNVYLDILTWADTVAPSFTLNLLPSSVLPFEIDVYAFATEELAAAPSAEMKVGDQHVSHTMSKLDDRYAITYAADFEVEQTGAYTLDVCGTDLSANEGCTQKVFTAARVFAGAETEIASMSGLVRLVVPAGALHGDAAVLCYEDFTGSYDTLKQLPDGFTPVGVVEYRSRMKSIDGVATIELDEKLAKPPHGNHTDLVLLAYTGDTLEVLRTVLDSEAKRHVASISHLGRYIIGFYPSAGSGDHSEIIPRESKLGQNWPNPFNAVTTIPYDVGEACQVQIEIFNLLGQRVAALVNWFAQPGRYTATWDARDMNGEECSSGVYFYRIESGSFVETKRMVLLK
jgi:subtilisin family serine protease